LENERLRAAITRSGLTLEEFADIVGVDVKTVQRWLRGRNPYAGNRGSVAAALDTPEHELWPDSVPLPSEPSERGQPTPLVTDVVAGYGHATDRDAPNPDDVLRSATERIELIVPKVVSGIVDLVLTKPADDCHVRAIVENPDGQVEPLLGIDGIEIHASPSGEELGLYRGDDQMLLVLPRIGVLSEPAPVIVLKRRTSGGLFDRLANEFEERWEQTTPLPTRERLHAYLAEVEPEPWPEQNPDSEPSTPPPPTSATPTALDPNAPRRWPRRPT
jgi:transcriptional regulator with XRE-family HTH domain